MKKLLFIGAVALAACFALSSCNSKITKEDVAKVNKLIKEKKCDEALKMVKGWEGKEFEDGVHRGDIEGEMSCSDELDNLVDNLGKKSNK